MKSINLFIVSLIVLLLLKLSAVASIPTPKIILNTPIKANTLRTVPVQKSNLTQTAAQPLDSTLFSTSKAGTILPDEAQTNIACGQIPNGTILVAWAKKTPENKHVGEAMFFTENMEFMKSVYFTFPSDSYQIGKIVVLGLENNSFLIAYSDINTHNGKYIILKDNGTPLFEPVTFSDSVVDSVTLTLLPGNETILLSYQKYSDISAKGEYQVLGLTGNKISGPITFNSKGMGTGMVPVVNNGLLDYYFGCGFSRSKTIDLFGNVIRDDVTFWHKANRAYQPILLENGNSLVLCIDDNYKPVSYLLDPQGVRLSGPTQFLTDDLFEISAVKLNSGHIFVEYTSTGGFKQRSSYITLLDENGNRIKEVKSIGDEFKVGSDKVAYTILNNKKALVVYSGMLWNENGNLSQKTTGYKIFTIE
ncbi:MAG: hypothetical protein WC527_04980 [Candidatus Margulisiibacteriota bacterium]